METITEISPEEITERVLDLRIAKGFPKPREGVIIRTESGRDEPFCTHHSIDYAILALSAAALGHDDVAKKALDSVMNRKLGSYSGDHKPKPLMRQDGFVLDHLPYIEYVAHLSTQFFWALALNVAGDASQVRLAGRILDNVEEKYRSRKVGLINKSDFFDSTGKRIFKEGTPQFTAEVNSTYALATAVIRGKKEGQRVLDVIRISPLYDSNTGLLVSDFAEVNKVYDVADRIYPFENVWYAFTLGALGLVKEGQGVFERMEQAGCYLDSGLLASFVSIQDSKPETYRGFSREALNASVSGVIAMRLLGLDERAEKMSEALKGMPGNLPHSSGIDPAYDSSTGLLYNGMEFDNLAGEFSHDPSLNCLWAVSQHEIAPKSFIVRR